MKLFTQLIKRDNRGIAQSIAVIGMVALVTGVLVFTIPAARNAVNSMWGVAASMVQRIDPPHSSASNTTPSGTTSNTTANSDSSQVPVDSSSSITGATTNPVQPPSTQTSSTSSSSTTAPSNNIQTPINPAPVSQPITGVEQSNPTIGNPVTNPVQPPVSDGTSSTTTSSSNSTASSGQTQSGYWVTRVNPDGSTTRYFVPTSTSSSQPVTGVTTSNPTIGNPTPLPTQPTASK